MNENGTYGVRMQERRSGKLSNLEIGKRIKILSHMVHAQSIIHPRKLDKHIFSGWLVGLLGFMAYQSL